MGVFRAGRRLGGPASAGVAAVGRMIIAIDGPAGSGKTTAAGRLAERLGLPLLASGAIYRAATWDALRSGVAWEEREAIARRIGSLDLRMRWGPRGLRVEVGGRDVTDEVFGPEVTRQIYRIADDGGYRGMILRWQRAYAEGGGVVAEGRDMGTVVFPEAPFKFFLTASARERARRRWCELRERGVEAALETVEREIEERDERDRRRAVSPLRPAPDAVVIDTTNRPIEEVVAAMEEVVRRGS